MVTSAVALSLGRGRAQGGGHLPSRHEAWQVKLSSVCQQPNTFLHPLVGSAQELLATQPNKAPLSLDMRMYGAPTQAAGNSDLTENSH